MKVILMQTVPGVGEAGAIKDVADGYARNFLLPKKLAMVATRGSVKQAEAQADIFARKANKARDEVQKAAAGIQDKTVTIRARAGSENRLYGSVTPADISEALQAQHGLSVDRRKITVDEAIHRLGTYSATADMGNGVTAKFNVEVAPEVAGASGKSVKASGEAPVEAAADAHSAGPDGSPSDAVEEPIAEAQESSSDETLAEEQAEAEPS